MANFYGAIALTGGGTGALDKLDGDILADGDAALVVTAAGFYIYFLDADSGLAENLPYEISPDSNAGTKRWILQIFNTPALEVFWKNQEVIYNNNRVLYRE